MKIQIEVSETVHSLLSVLTHGNFAPANVEGVIATLIDHAQQGVYRPGAWEREWLCQAFGDEWTDYLKPGDPYGRSGVEDIFRRPKTQEEIDQMLAAKVKVLP